MKLSAQNVVGWLELSRGSDESGYDSYQLAVRIQKGHGQFSAANADIHFLNPLEFVAELDAFILDRSRVPRLQGTYDSYLELACHGRTVWLRFRVGDTQCSMSKTTEFALTGEFEVHQESLLPLLDEVRGWSTHRV